MKKQLLLIIPALLGMGLSLVSCGDSEEEKAVTRAIYRKYKEDAIKYDTYVRFEVPSVDIQSVEEHGDTIVYEALFGIMEMYPSRNVYQKGTAKLVSIGGGPLEVDRYSYSECSLRDLP